MLYEVWLCVSTVCCGAEGQEFVQMIGTVTQVSCVQTFKCTATLSVFDLLTNASAVCANARLVSKMHAIRNTVKLLPGRRP